MRFPWVNTALLALLIVQLGTGAVGLASGTESMRWVGWLHSTGAYAMLLVLVWKAAIIVHAFRRRPRLDVSRAGFILLTILLVATLVTGFLWSYSGPLFFFSSTMMVVHGSLAVAVLLLLVWHVVARKFIFRVRASHDRRAFLRLSVLGVAGLALWRGATPFKTVVGLPVSRRRFTGSYEAGSLTGRFPETSWLFDAPRAADSSDWRLVIGGVVEQGLTLSYAEVLALASDTLTATVDCTGGWYSTQEWRGVRLERLLEMAGVKPHAASVTVQSVTGYGRRFSLYSARGYLLATHVAGEPLSHGHGAPMRLVAPGQRGYDWVKWVTRIQVNDTSAWLQPPLPLQ